MGITKAELLKRRKMGRPKVYDAAVIIKQLLNWANREDSINMVQFCADHGYLSGLIWKLESENIDFSRAYELAKMKLAARREQLVNAEHLNYGAYQRYQSQYDPFLRKAEKQEKDEDAARRKGIVESEQANFITLARLAADGKIKQKKK